MSADTRSTGPTILVDHVSRWFGSVVSVADISFQVQPGITGLLGPNGAGKTTLLRMICGLAEVSEGEVKLLDQPVRNNPEIYRRVGVMSEHESVYDFMNGRQFVQFEAKLRGVPNPDDATDEAIAYVGLEHAADRPMGTYSRGMRQRMRLAATIVHKPEVLLLDEPLNGTDPRQRVQFQGLLRKLAAEGRTILISSHILEEIEQLADTVLLIVAGKLAASGDYRAIRAKLNERPYHVRIVSDKPRELASRVVGLDSIDAVNVDPDGGVIVLTRDLLRLQRDLPKLAQTGEIRLLRVESLDDSLESVFGYLVGG
ncbi:MAG: ABC transporter ATP-binding protein [Chloroflexi bacterium]|nr:ABC transporter ATP-binding protein [Chloroflexota bacterium]